MRKILKRRIQNNNYVSFINTFDKYDNKYNISYGDFKLIIITFFALMKKEMIEQGKIFIFPKALGIFGLRKFRRKHRLFDYQHYRNTGEKRYTKNNHSEGFAAALDWDQHPLRRVDRMYSMFKIRTARNFGRDLAKYIKNENTISKYYDY